MRKRYEVLKSELLYEKLFSLMYDEEKTFREIAKIYDVDQHQISRLAKEYNIEINYKLLGKIRNKKREVKINNDELIDLYLNKDMSARQIAKIYNCNHYTIIDRLNKINIEIKPSYYIEYYQTRTKTNEEKTISKSKDGYLIQGNKKQHRIIMENYLERKLSKDEHVHHIDFNRVNNDINNLFIFTKNQHALYHGYIKSHDYISPQEFTEKIYPIYEKTIFSYDWLYTEYVTKNKSAKAISKYDNMPCSASIIKLLKEYGIWYLRNPTVNQYDK